MIVNKYAGSCTNCGETVDPGDGYAHLIGDEWVVMCGTCTSIPEIPRPARTGKCSVCLLNKQPHLINANGVCVDCE